MADSEHDQQPGHGAREHGSGGHGHGHGDELDWGSRGDEVEREGEVALPRTRSMAARLLDERGHDGVVQVVDVGAGPGVAACVLASVFPDAQVLVMDSAEPLLQRAAERARRLGLAERVSTRVGDLTDVADLPAADVIWASMTVHHTPDPAAVISGLADRLRSGGVLALIEGGLPTRFWYGEAGVGTPGFTARLDVAMGAAMAEHHGTGSAFDVRFSEDWPGLLRDAGLGEVRTRSHLLDLPAPLDDAARDYVRTHLGLLRDLAGEHLDEADRAAVARLLDPDDEAGIDRRGDLFVLGASTMHTARRLG